MQNLLLMGLPVLMSGMLWLYFINKCSLLSILILLEIMMYTLILVFYMPLLYMYFMMSYFVALFCFSAGGAAIGLTLLIAIKRLSGSDLIKNNL